MNIFTQLHQYNLDAVKHLENQLSEAKTDEERKKIQKLLTAAWIELDQLFFFR